MFARVYSLFTLFALLGMILSVSASPVLFPSYAVGPELKARICGRLGCKIAEFNPSGSSSAVSSTAVPTDDTASTVVPLPTEYVPESSAAPVPEASPSPSPSPAGADAPLLAAQSSGAREVAARLPVGSLAALSAVASAFLFVL